VRVRGAEGLQAGEFLDDLTLVVVQRVVDRES